MHAVNRSLGAESVAGATKAGYGKVPNLPDSWSPLEYVRMVGPFNDVHTRLIE